MNRIIKERLFTPGPTALLPQSMAAMAAMHQHHRTAEFRQLLRGVLDRLQAFLQTRQEVLLLASSGTGAMEAALANSLSPGERVLVLSAGKFGERWEKMAAAFGLDVVKLRLPYGESFTAAHLQPELESGRDFAAVLWQATESSTGVAHDTAGLARAVRAAGSQALLIVDGITGIGTSELDPDAWDLDLLIGGSQKAVMIPPGLAYLSVSERAWKRMETAGCPRFYFDLRRERAAQAQGETAFTPPTALVAALDAALRYIEQLGGRPALTANARFLAETTRRAAAALGLERFGHGAPAGALTALAAPAGLDSGVIVKTLRQQFGAIVANGQGEMKGKIFRIAHLGYYDFAETVSLIALLELTLAASGRLRREQLGAGVRAAQEYWLQTSQQPAAAAV